MARTSKITPEMLELLLPQRAPEALLVPRWGVVTSIAPLRVQLAGDDDHAILMTVHASDEAVYAAQVFPGLTLSAKPAKVTKGQKKKVTFVLNEGGQKLAGVKVTLKGAGAKGSCTTKGNGTCSIKVKAKKSGAIKVTATKPGFTKHLTKIKVKK